MKRIFTLFLCIITLTTYGCTNAGSYEENEGTVTLFPDYEYSESIMQYCAGSSAAINEAGYYYKFNSTLYYYDIDKDISTPLCSRTDCSHTTNKCDAYVTRGAANDALAAGNCIDSAIFYYNDHIYMIERDEDEVEYLVQYDRNFNNKEMLVTLSSGPESRYGTYGDNRRQCLISDGWFYYFNCDCGPRTAGDGNAGIVFCSRVKLEKGAKPERLGEYNLSSDYGLFGCSTSVICISKDIVYYISGGTTRWLAKKDPIQYRVAAYNTKTNEFEIVMSYTSDSAYDAWGENTGIVSYISGDTVCMDAENNLYMLSELGGKDCIVKYNMLNKKAEVIYKSPYEELKEIMCDGQNIFLNETNLGYVAVPKTEARIAAIDSSGTLLAAKEYEYDDSYIEYWKDLAQKRGQDVDKVLSTKGNPDINICCIDDRYVILMSYSDGIKGMISGDFSKNISGDGGGIGAEGVGLINKSDFLSGKACEIKQISKYWDN